MGKLSSKKVGGRGIDRRKKARSPSRRKVLKESRREVKTAKKEKRVDQFCFHCAENLNFHERILFVEEEVGRIFCSEKCITAYFQPDIERLERNYLRHLSPNDLNDDEREKYAHLRWMAIQEPDEIWREKTVTGDYRYTLISEFYPENRTVWSVCICLYLRGEPSFLYLAFPTRNQEMVNYYRKGERISSKAMMARSKGKREVQIPSEFEEAVQKERENDSAEPVMSPTDGLADAWTEDETLRARISRGRKADDIPSEDFGLYQSCLDETLQDPDEVWILNTEGEQPVQLYHFIREYPDEKPNGMWFVIVARDTDDQDEIEILDVFPTRDIELVECYRRGSREVGASEASTTSRLVH